MNTLFDPRWLLLLLIIPLLFLFSLRGGSRDDSEMAGTKGGKAKRTKVTEVKETRIHDDSDEE